ncbi:MAG: SPOR domain-containing protein [Bacteroidota bacterium]
MRKILLASAILCFCLSITQTVVGQDTLTRKATDTGLVRIFKDPRIDLLIAKQIEVNEYTTRTGRRVTLGFRLLVMNTKDRQEAINTKALIYEKFPELKPYLWHQAPYYKLKAGNFKNKEEAEAFAKKLRPLFPKGIFVMNDEIDTYFINTPPDPNKKQ